MSVDFPIRTAEEYSTAKAEAIASLRASMDGAGISEDDLVELLCHNSGRPSWAE